MFARKINPSTNFHTNLEISCQSWKNKKKIMTATDVFAIQRPYLGRVRHIRRNASQLRCFLWLQNACLLRHFPASLMRLQQSSFFCSRLTLAMLDNTIREVSTHYDHLRSPRKHKKQNNDCNCWFRDNKITIAKSSLCRSTNARHKKKVVVATPACTCDEFLDKCPKKMIM